MGLSESNLIVLIKRNLNWTAEIVVMLSSEGSDDIGDAFLRFQASSFFCLSCVIYIVPR